MRSLFPAALRKYLWSAAARRLALNRTLSCGLELKIRSYSDWCIYNDIFAEGEYDVAIKQTLRSSDKNATLNILDLGANVGFFTLRTLEVMTLAERARSRFILVEPSRSLINRLQTTFGSCRGGFPEVTIVQGLIGERSGTGNFRIEHEQIGNAVVTLPDTSTLNVDYIDLDRLLPGESRIALMKCDIEGCEKRFLENYPELVARTANAVFEFHEPACSVAEGTAKLAELGLTHAVRLRDSGPNQTWYFRQQTIGDPC
jgi:FkbM family methyltransferase